MVNNSSRKATKSRTSERLSKRNPKEQPEIITPWEHGEPCYSGVGMIDGKWSTYFMVDGGRTEQWTGIMFETADEAIELSKKINQDNGLRFI